MNVNPHIPRLNHSYSIPFIFQSMSGYMFVCVSYIECLIGRLVKHVVCFFTYLGEWRWEVTFDFYRKRKVADVKLEFKFDTP